VYSFQVYARITCIFISTEFFRLFPALLHALFPRLCVMEQYNYRLSPLSCTTLLLSTRVGEICARTSLIYVHSSSFIARSFSLNVNDRKRIPFLFNSRDKEHSTQHTAHHAFWRPTAANWLCLGKLRQQADRHTAEHSNVTNVCAQIYRAPQVLVGVRLSARGIREKYDLSLSRRSLLHGVCYVLERSLPFPVYPHVSFSFYPFYT
jgi:hypothetical protein